MIERTKAGKYRVRVDIGHDRYGRRKRNSKTVDTLREAKALEHKWYEEARIDAVVRDNLSLREFMYDYYLPDKEKRLRHSTVRRYRQEIEARLNPLLGHKLLKDIKRRDVQSLIDSCATYKIAKTARDVLRQILNYAIQDGFIHINVAAQSYDFPERTIYPEEHNGTWLTTFAEHDEFIAKIDNQLFKTIAVLGLSLGLRKGEIFGLDWEDIDLDNRMVHVRKTYVAEGSGYKLMPPKTHASDRYIPLRVAAAEYLKTIKRASGPVVVNKYGHRASPNKCARRWTGYTKKHELAQVSMLNMRHSFATACVNAGIEIAKVSRMLGHTQVSTTVQRYVRFKAEDIKAEFDKMTMGQNGDNALIES